MNKSKKGTTISYIKKYLPIIRWLHSYTIRKFISDMIAGITVGITMIPQSIAYASLAGLGPQYGLNSAFVGCFIYGVFGTVREIFIGPSSMLSLLAATYTRNISIEAIIFLTFLTGCVGAIMALFRLGFLVDFISVPVIGGFVSAIAITIFVSQLKDLTGLKFKSGGVAKNLVSVTTNYSSIKFSDLTLGLTCIIILLLLRQLKDVKIKKTKSNGFLRTAIWFLSLSRNAIVVLVCMIITAFFRLNMDHVPYAVTESVHSGIPAFKVPPFTVHVSNATFTFTDMVQEFGMGTFIIPIVGILENIAIAKAFSKGKTIAVTQEMFSLSFSNILASFFGAMPTCGALTRSAVGSSSGVQTPIASIFAGSVVLLAVQFLSPYFHLIPRATLAAILICAVIFLVEWDILIPLWKTSRKDFFIMVATFSISISCGVEIGLLFGVAFSLLGLLHLWARPKISSEICTSSCGQTYIILTVDKGLYFPSLSYMREVILKQQQTEQTDLVVLNCTNFSGYDYTAVKELSVLVHDLNEQGQELCLLNVTNQFIELCHNVGHCKDIAHYCFSSKEDLEYALWHKGDAVIKELNSKECTINSSNGNGVKEMRALLDDIQKKENNL